MNRYKWIAERVEDELWRCVENEKEKERNSMHTKISTAEYVWL